MKIAIMQPYFFPYLGYWQLINAVDLYVIYDDVNFIKGGWINRNNILMNGKPARINLQIDHVSQNKLINQVQITGNEVFNRKLLKTLEHCYKKAPYFSEVIPVIERVIMQKENNLVRYLEFSIKSVCEYLSIETEMVLSSNLPKDNSLRWQDKIIEICKLLKADEYINAIGGQDLYSYPEFLEQGIELKFLKTYDISYPQFSDQFAPNLSIIDVMMFNSPERIGDYLEDYEMILPRKGEEFQGGH